MSRSAFVMVFALFMVACASDPVLTSDFEVSNPRDGLWQNAPNAPIRFVLEQTWGVEDGQPEEMLARVGPLEVDASGNIYMLDSRAPMLTSWDASGSHRWTLSAKGEGPQEFQSAWSMVFDGQSSLYVFNQSGSRIDRISSDGEFLDSFTTESLGLPRLGGIGMPSPDVIVASETLWNKLGVGVRVLKRSGDAWVAADTFDVDQTDGVDMPDGVASGPSVQVLDGRIVNNHVSKYLFEFRSLDGRVERIVSRDIDGLVRPGTAQDGGRTMISNFSQLGQMRPAAGGYYLVEASWPDQEIDPDSETRIMLQTRRRGFPWGTISTLDLYDASFNLLYSIDRSNDEEQLFGRILTSDNQGRIYAAMNTDFPQIGRFRVEVTPPN